MRFIFDAPGFLIPDGSGGYTAKWSVPPDNVGYSQAAVEAQISDALNDSRAWGQLGITYEHVPFPPTDPYTVVFSTVASTTSVGSPEWSWAVTVYWDYFGPNDPPHTQVLIESAHFADLGIPNHEAAHAYFGATHSPEGSDSIMEPMEDPGSEWPSETDLAQVAAWLGNAPDPDTGEGGNPNDDGEPVTRWFPANLPDYSTVFPVPSGCRARVTANVTEGAKVALLPVHASSYADLMAGDYRRFGDGVDCFHEGLAVSRWAPVTQGERFVGVSAHADSDAELDALRVGLCEVQIRSD